MSATRTAMRVPHPGSREWRPAELLDSFVGWKTAVLTALSEDAPDGDITTETFIAVSYTHLTLPTSDLV